MWYKPGCATGTAPQNRTAADWGVSAPHLTLTSTAEYQETIHLLSNIPPDAHNSPSIYGHSIGLTDEATKNVPSSPAGPPFAAVFAELSAGSAFSCGPGDQQHAPEKRLPCTKMTKEKNAGKQNNKKSGHTPDLHCCRCGFPETLLICRAGEIPSHQMRTNVTWRIQTEHLTTK